MTNLPVRLRARLQGALENAAVLALLFGAGCLWMFLGIADEVREGEWSRIDEAVLLALRTPGDLASPIGPHWLPGFARDITSLGGPLVLIVLVALVAGFLLVARMTRLATFLVLATGSGAIASQLLKAGYSRPRPDIVPHGMEALTASFPSGHAMGATLVYLTLAVLVASMLPTRALRIYVVAVAVLISIAIGLTRLYLGVHWPTDVAAGWVAGAGWSLACWAAALHWRLIPRRG